MKKIIVGIALIVVIGLTVVPAYAGCTNTLMSINGRPILCTTCCNAGLCNTICG